MKIGKPRGDNYKLVLSSLQASQRDYIEVLASCSLSDLKIHLEAFPQWVWDRSDLLCWAPVLNRLDDIFRGYLDSYRGYLKGEHDNISCFYNEDLLSIVINGLKASIMIVENSTSKSIYNSIELLISLLDDVHPDIAFLATKLLCVYFSRQRRSTTPKDVPEISERIAILSQTPLPDSTFLVHATKGGSFGGNADQESVEYKGTGEFDSICYSDIIEYYVKQNRYFLTLRSYVEIGQETVRGNDASKLRMPVVDILNLGGDESITKVTDGYAMYEGNEDFMLACQAYMGSIPDELSLYKQMVKNMRFLIRKYKVEDNYVAELKYRMCKVHSMYFPFMQRKLIELRLCSLICMLIINNSTFNQFLSYNPSFLLELTHMIKRHTELDRNTMVVTAELLSAMVYDGIHSRTLTSVLGLNSPHGIFTKVLLHYLNHATEMDPLPPLLRFKNEAETKVLPNTGEILKQNNMNSSEDRNEKNISSLQMQGYVADPDNCLKEWNWVERFSTEEGRAKIHYHEDSMRILLQLLIVFYTTISYHGCTNTLTNTSVLEGVVRFIRMRDPIYLPVVIYVVQVLEALLEYNQTVSRTLRKNLQVFYIFVSRLQYDMYLIENNASLDDPTAEATPWPQGWKMPASNDILIIRSYWMSLSSMSARRFLFKTIVRNIDTAARSMTGRSESHDQNIFTPDGPVIPILLSIFRKPHEYGLSAYGSAINLIADAIGEDPVMQEELHSVDIIPSLLKSISEGTLKSEDCLQVVPGAICDILMHRSGQEWMLNHNYAPALKLIDIVAKKDFVLFDRFGEVASSIGATLGTISRNDTARALILERLIQTMQELLAEGLQYPAFKPKDSSRCAKDLETSLHEFRTHPPAINSEFLSHSQWRSENDFYADRIAHLGKCLSSCLSFMRPLSQFISVDGLRLMLHLCSVPCLPPLSMLIYSQHPMATIIKFILSHSPSPSVTYLHNLCIPYLLQKQSYRDPEKEEDIVANIEYLKMFHGISYMLYQMHRDESDFYNSSCQGKYQAGAEDISRCDMHLTISYYLRRLVGEIPFLMQQFFKVTDDGDRETFFILSTKHLPHEHPQLKAYKIYNRDSKLSPSQSESSFSANDLFWTSQFEYAYSIPNPSYAGSPYKDISDDKYKMNTEACRLSLVTAKALLYSLNATINKVSMHPLYINPCSKKYVAHHSVMLSLLCIKMLNSVPSVEGVEQGSEMLLKGMDMMNTARFVAETMEMIYKLLTEDRTTRGLYILSFVVFIRLSGMYHVKVVFDYMFYSFFGCILALAMRTNPGLKAEEVLGNDTNINISYLMTVVHNMQHFDLKKMKYTMETFSRSILLCLALFTKICNPKTALSTDYDTDILEYTSSDVFSSAIPRTETTICDLMTNTVAQIGSSCWTWLKMILSMNSVAPGNSTASPHFYVSSKLLGSLIKVNVYVVDFLSDARQQDLQKHFDPSSSRPRDGTERSGNQSDRMLSMRRRNRRPPVIDFSEGEDNIDDHNTQISPLEETRSRLNEMGFDNNDIDRAISACGNADMVSLTNWLISRANELSEGANERVEDAIQIDETDESLEHVEMNQDKLLTTDLLPYSCTPVSEDDIWNVPIPDIVNMSNLSDITGLRSEISSSIVELLLGLSSKMSSSLGVICDYMFKSFSFFKEEGNKNTEGNYSANGQNDSNVLMIIDFIYNGLESVFSTLSKTSFSMTKEGMLPVFCPVIFVDDVEKQIAFDSTILANKTVLNLAYDCSIAKLHEKLLGLFYLLSHLIGGKEDYTSLLLKNMRNPVDMILKFIGFFQNIRYQAHTAGVITFAGIGMKPTLPGVAIAVPDWCTHIDFSKFHGKDKGTFKTRVDYSLASYGFIRNFPIPQMSCVPPFFKYALACISELLKKHYLIGLSKMLASSMDFSKNVEILSITNNMPFFPKNSQKKLVHISLNILECFPGANSDVVFSLLSILDSLTEAYSNAIELLNYKRLPLQENYPAHFNSKVEFEDIIGADAFSILLTIPKSGECKGILKLVSRIIMHCMENPTMLRESIERNVISLLSNNDCEPMPLVKLVEKAYPFIKKDPTMFLKILQKNCVLTLEDGATNVDLCKACITLCSSARITDLLSNNAELLHPGSIPILENFEDDCPPFPEHNVLLLHILRLMVVYMQIFCNIHGLTRVNINYGEVSKPGYPYALTVKSLFYITSTVCYNFPVTVTNNRTPKLELDMPHKPFPWRVNMIDVKDSHVVLLQIVRRIFLMLCSLSVPQNRTQPIKDNQQEIASMHKLIVSTLDSYTNSVMLIASRSAKVCLILVEELKILLLFLIGFNARECGPHFFPLAAYTVCNLLQNLLQLRFDNDKVELNAESAFHIKKCLVTLLRRLDLYKDGASVLCNAITRALVLVTSSTRSDSHTIAEPVELPKRRGRRYDLGSPDVDDADIALDVESESYDSDDDSISSEEDDEDDEDDSEGDSEDMDEYIEDAMDEDIATDTSDEPIEDSMDASDAYNDSHYISDSDDDDDDERSDSSDSDDLDTDRESEGANDVDMVLPHQVDENYQADNNSDSSSHSSMDEIEEDEDDDDAPRIRVVGELDEEGRDGAISDFVEGTRSHLNMTDNEEQEIADESQVSSEDDGFILPPALPTVVSNMGTDTQNNNMSINIDEGDGPRGGTVNGSFRIQIEISNPQAPMSFSDQVPPHSPLIPPIVPRTSQNNIASSSHATDRGDTWASNGDLSIPPKHPMLPPTKKSASSPSLQNGEIINLIALSLPKIQIPRVATPESSEQNTEERASKASVESSPIEQRSQDSDQVVSATVVEQDSSPAPRAYDNPHLERIAIALGIRYDDLFSLASMDQSVIAELPEDMREEILFQQLGTIDVEALAQVRENRPIVRPNRSTIQTNRNDMYYVDSLPRSLRSQVIRYLFTAPSPPATRDSSGSTLPSTGIPERPFGAEREWLTIGPNIRDHLVQGATQAFLEALAPNLILGGTTGITGRFITRDSASDGNMNEERGMIVRDPPISGENSAPHEMDENHNPNPHGLTFGLIIGQFNDGNNLRIRSANLSRNRAASNNNNPNRRFISVPPRHRFDVGGGRGFNLNDVVFLDGSGNRIRFPGQNSMDSGESIPIINPPGIMDTQFLNLRPLNMGNNRRNRLGPFNSQVLRTLPQLLNTFQPHFMNAMHNSLGRNFGMDIQGSSHQHANANNAENNAEIPCDRIVERVVKVLPKSVCENVTKSHGGENTFQLLDTCRVTRNEFMETDIIGICKLIYLKEEINKKVFFKLLHNLSASDMSICHLLLKYFIYIIHSSILSLSHTSVSNLRSDTFFSRLPKLYSSRKDDFPPAHLYGSLPIRAPPSLTSGGQQDTRLETESKYNTSILSSTTGGRSHFNGVDLHSNSSSYVSCERVLEQLRSLMIALPATIDFFSKKISATNIDDATSRFDYKTKRTKTMDLPHGGGKASRSQEFYPIGFLFMATATKLFQSSPKLMNHLLMVIHHLIVRSPSYNVSGSDEAILDSSRVMVETTTPTESLPGGEVIVTEGDISPLVDNPLPVEGETGASGSFEGTQASRTSKEDLTRGAQQYNLVNNIDSEAVRVFLDLYSSWNHQSNWLHNLSNSRDGAANNQLHIVARIMAALHMNPKHSKEVTDHFATRIQELSDELCEPLMITKMEENNELEYRIAALLRITLLVNEMFTEAYKTHALTDKKTIALKPRKMDEFYNRIDLEKLWISLDIALTNATKSPAAGGTSSSAVEQSNDIGSPSTRDQGIECPVALARLNTLIPLIEVFMTITQIRVALDYLLEDVTELENAISFINFDYELPEGNLDFLGVSKQERASPKKEPWDCDDTSVEISSNHLSLIYFTEKHAKAFNALIKQTPSLLSSSFIAIVRLAPNCLSFSVKRQYFRQKLKESRQGPRPDTVRINVRREHVFMDSYHQLRLRSGEEMKGRLSVTFSGEEGVDAGGLTREWFNILAKEMFNPNYGLFRREGRKQEFNHPNPLSGINPDHLNFFKFIGRVIGKAVYDGQHIEAYFCRSFYKHMLCRKISPADAQSVDPQFYENLTSINNCRLEDLGLELYFSTEIDEFGMVKVIDLIPDGRNIHVTDENKHKYIELLCRHKVTNAIKDQLDAFMSGFQELISPELISIFDDKELELLISGIPTIDLCDMRDSVEYVNYTESSEQIIWLWEFLEGLDQNNLAAFLQFVTGTSRVPIGGFKNLMGMRGPQRISIHRTFGSERLPSAHTCFNQLDLPAYSSRETLHQKMLQAILEGKEGFGFI